jgi:hypothetical protein
LAEKLPSVIMTGVESRYFLRINGHPPNLWVVEHEPCGRRVYSGVLGCSGKIRAQDEVIAGAEIRWHDRLHWLGFSDLG